MRKPQKGIHKKGFVQLGLDVAAIPQLFIVCLNYKSVAVLVLWFKLKISVRTTDIIIMNLII